MLALPLGLLSDSRVVATRLGWASLTATLLNSHWLFGLEEGINATDPQVGYYLWWLSFAVAAAGAFWYARQLPANDLGVRSMS